MTQNHTWCSWIPPRNTHSLEGTTLQNPSGDVQSHCSLYCWHELRGCEQHKLCQLSLSRKLTIHTRRLASPFCENDNTMSLQIRLLDSRTLPYTLMTANFLMKVPMYRMFAEYFRASVTSPTKISEINSYCPSTSSLGSRVGHLMG